MCTCMYGYMYVYTYVCMNLCMYAYVWAFAWLQLGCRLEYFYVLTRPLPVQCEGMSLSNWIYAKYLEPRTTVCMYLVLSEYVVCVFARLRTICSRVCVNVSVVSRKCQIHKTRAALRSHTHRAHHVMRDKHNILMSANQRTHGKRANLSRHLQFALRFLIFHNCSFRFGLLLPKILRFLLYRSLYILLCPDLFLQALDSDVFRSQSMELSWYGCACRKLKAPLFLPSTSKIIWISESRAHPIEYWWTWIACCCDRVLLVICSFLTCPGFRARALVLLKVHLADQLSCLRKTILLPTVRQLWQSWERKQELPTASHSLRWLVAEMLKSSRLATSITAVQFHVFFEAKAQKRKSCLLSLQIHATKHTGAVMIHAEMPRF